MGIMKIRAETENRKIGEKKSMKAKVGSLKR